MSPKKGCEWTQWISALICMNDDRFYGASLLILKPDFILVLTKYVLISSSRSKYVIRFSALLTLPNTTSCPSFRLESEELRQQPLKMGETPQEIRGEMPQLNNSKSVWKMMLIPFIQSTKYYLLSCSIFQIVWIVVSKDADKTTKIVAHIQTWEDFRHWWKWNTNK